MKHRNDTCQALVCANRSKDVLRLMLDVDENGIIESSNATCFGSLNLHKVAQRVSIVHGEAIEDAITCEPEDFMSENKDASSAIMLVNAVRLAIKDYVDKVIDK